MTDLAQYGQTFGADEATQADSEMSSGPIRPGKLDANKWHWFRVVPLRLEWMKAGVKSPFFEYHKHIYEDPQNPGSYIAYACPRHMANQPCHDCSHSAQLRRTNDKDSPGFELGKDMGSKHVRLVAVLPVESGDVTPADDAVVQVLELSAPNGRPSGKSQYEKLIAKIKDPDDGGDVMNPNGAFNFAVKKSGKGRYGTEYEFKLARNTTPLHADGAKAIAWIEGQPDIPAMIREETQRGIEIAAQIAAGTYGGAKADNVTDTTARPE